MDIKHHGILLAVSVLIMAAVAAGISMVLSRLPGPYPGRRPAPGVSYGDQSRPPGKSVAWLYFSDARATGLIAEERLLDHPKDTALFGKAIVDALIAGPREHPVGTIPNGTLCRAVYITDSHTAHVDMSVEISADHPGGTEAELMTIYSIVNSLVLNIPEVKAVKILVDGKESETLAGQVDIRYPFIANMLMIK